MPSLFLFLLLPMSPNPFKMMTPWLDSRKPEYKYRRVLVITSVLAITMLILSLTLLIIDRLRPQDSSSLWDYSSYDIKDDPWEYNLSKNNFTISRVPATRYYEWTISQHVTAPDGFERPMLLVNGN